ncbi:MAG: hypothetical protein K8L97_17235 [Anaerolineae bacterium]|nr:hypothetical protein [Anaerolineae bacterium]
MNSSILILNPIPDENVDNSEWRGEHLLSRSINISTDLLAQNAKLFISSISTVFKEIDSSFSSYELEQVEITAAITASGKFSLIALNSEVGAQGSIKFVFKRNVT